jgi:hypothetical protein
MRCGFHSQPTVLVLTFNKQLDVAGANNAANYKIVPIGPRGKFGGAMARAPWSKQFTLTAGALRTDLHGYFPNPGLLGQLSACCRPPSPSDSFS